MMVRDFALAKRAAAAWPSARVYIRTHIIVVIVAASECCGGSREKESIQALMVKLYTKRERDGGGRWSR